MMTETATSVNDVMNLSSSRGGSGATSNTYNNGPNSIGGGGGGNSLSPATSTSDLETSGNERDSFVNDMTDHSTHQLVSDSFTYVTLREKREIRNS